MVKEPFKLRSIKFFGTILAVFMFVMVQMGSFAYAESNTDIGSANIKLDTKKMLSEGYNHFNNQDYDKAIEVFNKVIEKDPENFRAYYGRAYAYSRKSMYDKSIKDFNKLEKINPSFPWTYAIRGSIYAIQGMKDKAKEDYDSFFKYVKPNDPDLPAFKNYLTRSGYLKKIETVEYDSGNATMNQLLIKGVENNDLEMVQMAVSHGANVNIYYNRNHWETPLSMACSYNNINIIDFLLDSGADPNVIVYDSPFILHFLSYNNERPLSLIQHLIDRGADIKAHDKNGNTVLTNFFNTLSSYEYKKSMTKYFISQGVDVNYQNKDGDTPLHSASARGYIEIVKMLLDAGADPNKINQYSKRPLDYAINSGNKELISLLLPLTKM